jgi:hypothetical protein
MDPSALKPPKISHKVSITSDASLNPVSIGYGVSTASNYGISLGTASSVGYRGVIIGFGA